MRTAKQMFQGSPVFKDYQNILTNPAFEAACATALSEYVDSLPKESAEPSKSWDCYLKILGARAVLDTLSRLHEPDTESTPTKWPALKYEANQPKTRP